MTKIHAVPAPVLAYPVFGVYADYDANAPDTETFFLVATEELAKEVCGFLNQNPRKWSTMGFVDGYEWSKSYKFRPELSLSDDILVSFDPENHGFECDDEEED